jgi:tripartite-type tricarboxylate transporter receptor subunit TctC
VPRAIVAKVSAAVAEVVHAPDVVQRFSADGSTPVSSKPEVFAAHLRNEVAKWRRLAKETGLQME